jgi:chromosome segregation ATPase
MSSNNDIEKHYLMVKKKLEHFQYNSPLGLDSVQLAEKLLTDLLKTTQGFQEMKVERDRLKDALEAEKLVPLPLRNENAKLLKENNELHRDLIKLKEELDSKEVGLGQSIRKLEAEKEEAKFLLSHKNIHIKNIENESEGLRKKFNEVLSKVYGTENFIHSTTFSQNPNMGLPNAEKILKNKNRTINPINIIGKKNEIDMTKGLDPSSNYENLMKNVSNKKILIHEMSSPQVNKEEWARDLKIADERAQKFRDEIQRLQEDKKEMENKLLFLERQIQNRDNEIRRVQNTYLNTDNIEELKVRYQTDNMKLTVEKLNSQIDFLNRENHKLQDVVDFHNARCKEDEVRKLDREIIQLKKDKEALNRKIEMFEKNSNYSSQIKKDNPNQIQTNKLESDQILFSKLKEEISHLKKDLEKSREAFIKLTEDYTNLNSNFNTERLALMKTIDQLKEESIIQSNQILELENSKNSLIKQNESILTELNLIKGREFILNKDFENKADNTSKIVKEYNDLNNEYKNLTKKITDLQDKNVQLIKENKELCLEKEQLISNRGNIERNSSMREEEINKYKTQFESLSRNLEKYVDQIKVLEAKRKFVEEENQNINSILENKNSLIKDLESKCDNYLRQIQDSNENYSTLQIEHKNLSADFTEILNNKKKLEEKIRSIEKDLTGNESKYVKEKLSEYEEKEKILKTDLRQIERENKTIKNELRSLNDIISENNSYISILKTTIENLEQEKKVLQDKLEMNSNEILQMEENTKYLSNINSSIDDYKQKVLELSNKIVSMKSEIEKLKSDKSLVEFDLKKKVIEISKIIENLSRKDLEFNVLKSENKSLNEENEKIKEELLMKRLSENNNLTSTTAIIELNDTLQKEQLEKEKAIFQYNTLNDKFIKLNEIKANLESKILQLTNLINEADNTRGELFSKLQDEMNKNKTNENELQILKERERSLDIDMNKLRDENNKLKQGITSIDQNFDNLNNELDNKTEEISKLNLLVNNLKEQNEDLTKKLSGQLNKGNIEAKRILERENDLKELRNILNILQNENRELKSSLNERSREIQDLNYDLRCLQGENGTLVEEITLLSKENEKLQIFKIQLEKNSEMITQKFRSNEFDLNELHSNYTEACKENERLKQNLKIFLDENREASTYIKKIEGQLSNYQNNISSSVSDRENLLKKIDFLEKYNSELTLEVSKLKEELNLRGSEHQFLRENVKLDREINLNYENHIANLNRQIAKLENEKQMLTDNVNTLNNRLEYMNHNKGKFEENNKNYEALINEERKKAIIQNSNIQKLKDEVNYLRDENSRIVNMINENRDIKELKNKILGNALNNSENNLNYSGNTGRTPNFISSNETVTSEDENAILKRFISDLNCQIEDLKRDLRNVRDENTRLMSERSIRENMFSERNMSHSGSNSVSSNHSEA